MLAVTLGSVISFSSLAETTTCNQFGGNKRDAWWSYQTCDFLTKKPITPLIATQMGYAESTGSAFEIYVTAQKAIIKQSVSGMYPPLLKKVTLVVDSGQPYEAEILNYGFYPIVRDPIREAHITGEDYERLKSELKRGDELRVLWEQEAIPQSYNVRFSLLDAELAIQHLDSYSKVQNE